MRSLKINIQCKLSKGIYFYNQLKFISYVSLENCQDVAEKILAKVWTEDDLDLKLYAKICGYLGSSEDLFFIKKGKQYFKEPKKNVSLYSIFSNLTLIRISRNICINSLKVSST